jgi:hypothetical protein
MSAPLEASGMEDAPAMTNRLRQVLSWGMSFISYLLITINFLSPVGISVPTVPTKPQTTSLRSATPHAPTDINACHGM